MDLESPLWEEWENQFNMLAQQAEKVTLGTPIADAQHYLCLYGENGLAPEAELQELDLMASKLEKLKKVEVDTGYWQDTVLFVPRE
jgi:hypothetical protein